MRLALRGAAALAMTAVLAACGGGGPTTAPTGAAGTAPAGTSPAGTTAAELCEDSTGTTVVAVGVEDNTWEQPINAKVGDVITWTNGDGVPHAVGTDDGRCTMSGTIAGSGGTKSLVFNEAGSFPFHCTVHPSMKGTITIAAA